MKKFVKVAALVLVAALLVGCFAACGTKTDGKTEAKGEIFIGATGPLTGDASSYGISVKNGAEIAIAEINAAGGLNGITLKFEIKDDKAAAADATTAYDALMDAGMQVALGSVTSGSCEAFAGAAQEDNLFFMTPSASAANIITYGSNSFRVCFGDPDQGILAAQNLADKFEKIGCIYDTSDPYSTGVYDAFESEMKNLNKTYEVRTFDADNKKDFSAQVDALKDCDVIFLPIYYTEAGLIANACASKGVDAVLFGCDGLDGIADQIDKAVVKNDISYITPFDVNSKAENVSKFVAAYEEKYGVKPDQFAADAYDAVYAIFEGMKAAGIDDANISASDLSDALQKAITAEGFVLKGLTGEMTWDATGACTKVPVIVEL
ncbi:MAG: ABC transporter substrate-binding protein [Oscillospiraceae bacterium]|nr:ABC transporter substrate-binding protein [Oscillospiraceae bacterium]